MFSYFEIKYYLNFWKKIKLLMDIFDILSIDLRLLAQVDSTLNMVEVMWVYISFLTPVFIKPTFIYPQITMGFCGQTVAEMSDDKLDEIKIMKTSFTFLLHHKSQTYTVFCLSVYYTTCICCKVLIYWCILKISIWQYQNMVIVTFWVLSFGIFGI